MKKSVIHRIILLAICILISAGHYCYADIGNGLCFKSYQVSPSDRTSLCIPSNSHSPIHFSDSLLLSFQLNVNLNVGRFGYVCRVILNESESIDILLYTPSKEPTYICATGDHENLVKIPMEQDRWQELSLVLKNEKGFVRAVLNGKDVAGIRFDSSRILARLCFGKNDFGVFTTNDVAPMIIKDLCLKIDGGSRKTCKLEDASSLVSLSGLEADVVNPIWKRELNSSWSHLASIKLPSVSHICPDNKRSVVYAVSDRMVTAYDLERMSFRQWVTSVDIRFNLVDSDFIVLEDGALAYFDRGCGHLIRFNMEKGDWEYCNPRTEHSGYMHANCIKDDEKGEFIHLFGYGQHRYSNEVDVWNEKSGNIEKHILEGVGPRYLAAAGKKGDKIFIFGGKGNLQGAQELGTVIYGDLLEVDINDFSVRSIWPERRDCSEVGAADILFEDNRESMLILCYNPDEYKTFLQLKRFSLDGESTALAAPLPYNFLDIESEARLLFSRTTQCYYAVFTQKDDNGSYSLNIYSILSPILERKQKAEVNESQIGTLFLFFAVVIVLIIAVVFLFIRIRRKKEQSDVFSGVATSGGTAPRQSNHSLSPGIYLLDTFRVITSHKEDISAKFSPLMRQLLSIIILNSGEAGGISNSRLKEALWFDKSDESYNNNRGVTLKKIRDYLELVNPRLNIISDKGRWVFLDPDGCCDYLNALKVLQPSSSSLDVIEIAVKGTLLSDMHLEWLDAYKSEYEDRVISRLRSITIRTDDDKSAQFAVKWADAMLTFDYLDEDSLRIKCQALITLKRNGTAMRVFETYKENYRRMMGEELDINFNVFLKN